MLDPEGNTIGPDRFLSPEIEATYRLVRDGAVLAAAEQHVQLR